VGSLPPTDLGLPLFFLLIAPSPVDAPFTLPPNLFSIIFLLQGNICMEKGREGAREEESREMEDE